MIDDEEWRPIPGFPDYAVSSWGNVTRIGARRCQVNGKLLGVKPQSNGYRSVALYADDGQTSKGVHVLVCEAFHGPRPSPLHEAAHWDGDKLNNRKGNVRWATRYENAADSIRLGVMRFGDRHHSRLRPEVMARGERNGGGGKLTEEKVRSILADKRKHTEIAKDHGVVKSMVAMIKRREVWKHVSEVVQ